jgi:tRNA threonylcarbamoyladenosine biosynthesis protein TsaB
VAKGIAFGASIPLIGIETTLSMFWGLRSGVNHLSESDTLYCPMLDARRMEVYYAIYDSTGKKLKDISAEIINNESFSDIPESTKMILFGDGALKCKDVIARKNLVFSGDYLISASHMLKPVFNAFENNHFEDVAYFEPLYLKDFITSKPRKNIFGK